MAPDVSLSTPDAREHLAPRTIILAEMTLASSPLVPPSPVTTHRESRVATKHAEEEEIPKFAATVGQDDASSAWNARGRDTDLNRQINLTSTRLWAVGHALRLHTQNAHGPWALCISPSSLALRTPVAESGETQSPEKRRVSVANRLSAHPHIRAIR
ncbi:hypothetical protein BDW02DRAFT_576746 [Decorospora gaudefroyi]|uniref:Uncharacterized protein n=1 Tax=Decorospora gaudefroyi TaxID=184978 RepID=A0A6A5KI60_9PLEO|nr:hypothetical protein BDW02DRAFT_576746 [Decorospora gaudefroyi]